MTVLEFFDPETTKKIDKQIFVFTLVFGIFSVIDAELMVIISTLDPTFKIGWTTIQNLAVGLTVVILNVTKEYIVPEVNNEAC